ncbi:PAS domain S-box protein [Nostoc sp. UHCC 0870]
MQFDEHLIDLPTLYHGINLYPLTIDPDSYVVDAIALMYQKRNQILPFTSLNAVENARNWYLQKTSCVLVVEAEKVLGILTERDIFRLAGSNIDFSEVKMAEVMAQPVIKMKLSHFQDILKALSVLHNHQIGHLPIVDDDERLVGVVTANSLLHGFNQLPMVNIVDAVNKPQVNLNQTRPAALCYPADNSNKLGELLTENKQRQIYVYGGVAEDITERKQTEELLRQSEERLVLALTSAHMGIFDWNLLTNDTLWSANMGLLYGLPQGTICPSPEAFLELVHPEDRTSFQDAVKCSIEQHQKFAITYRVIWPDGSIHWLSSRGETYYNEIGQPIRMIGTTRDISDRKQAEAALKESEERYRSVVAAMQEGVVLHERDGKVVACNASAEKILGLSSDRIIGRVCDASWRSIYTDGSPFPDEKHPAMVSLHTGEPCSNVIMGIEKPNGQLTWLSINSQPLFRNNESTPYEVVVSFSDITEQQQAEQKIREQAALLDVATDAIFVRDLNNHILFWNRGAESLYGWSASEILGTEPKTLLDPETSAHRHKIALKTVIAAGVWQGELQKITKSGQNIIVESRWTVMRDAAGKPKSILIVDTDITQKKQLEEQFFRTQRLESLGTLAGGIAHDLNNILTPILAAAQLLQNRNNRKSEPSSIAGGKRSQQLLKIIENNAQRGAGLVKQVLSFARGCKGERTIIQLKHLITDIILIGKQTFPKSIECATKLPEDLCAVSGNATQLHQVLMNLVVNARDAMPKGGKISISAENIFIDEAYASMNINAQVGHYILVKICDTGIGMPPKILDRIFEPFFTTKEAGTGTGLGLSTVLGITKSHGGFVTVTSKVGEGSQFNLFLPAVSAIPDLITENAAIPQGNGELILVVDDEVQICEIIKMILENHNYRTLTANNGIEAIALYAQHKHQINAIVMDMLMPEMNGETAIRTLQKMNPKVQIIACSGQNSPAGLEQVTGIGVDQVLPKPFTTPELLNSLHNLLKKSAV